MRRPQVQALPGANAHKLPFIRRGFSIYVVFLLAFLSPVSSSLHPFLGKEEGEILSLHDAVAGYMCR